MRFVCLMLAAGILSALASTVAADDEELFIGLFEGVDPGDGSLTQRQITCDDGLCTVLGSDSFFSLCAPVDGRGILQGEGEVRDGVLVVPGFTLTCAGDEIDPVTVDTTFTADPTNEAIVEQTASPMIAPITFHRINRALKARR